jgi:hypothetical protein
MEPVLLITLIAKYGPSVIIQVIEAWKAQGEPTEAEIEALGKRVPPPTDYFPDAGSPGEGS